MVLIVIHHGPEFLSNLSSFENVATMLLIMDIIADIGEQCLQCFQFYTSEMHSPKFFQYIWSDYLLFFFLLLLHVSSFRCSVRKWGPVSFVVFSTCTRHFFLMTDIYHAWSSTPHVLILRIIYKFPSLYSILLDFFWRMLGRHYHYGLKCADKLAISAWWAPHCH